MLPIVTVIKARNIAKYITYSSFTGLQYNRDVITSYVKQIINYYLLQRGGCRSITNTCIWRLDV